MRILHVENDPVSAALVRKMLEGVVEDCDWTELGEAALGMAQEADYDLILLDVMLPDIDGYEVLSRLRSAKVSTPCLILSGLVDRDSEFSTLAFGVSDYLVKPFSRAELVSRIQSMVARGQGLGHSESQSLPAYHSATRTTGDESRKFRRFTTIKSATIDISGGVRCRVVNMSHFGAGLRLLAEAEKLPRSFMLIFDSGETQLCRMSWRDGERMGVKFIDSQH